MEANMDNCKMTKAQKEDKVILEEDDDKSHDLSELSKANKKSPN